MLANVDRRMMIHLAIPRNVEDATHQLRVDPGSRTRSEADTAKHLARLVQTGYVVELPEQQQIHRLTSRAQDHKKTIEMTDAKAERLISRLSDSRRAWRATGKQYMLSEAGLEAIKAPTGEEKSFTTSEMKDLLTEQAKYVEDDIKKWTLPDDERMWVNPHMGEEKPLPYMLTDEWTTWVQNVIQAHEKTWGEGSIDQLRSFLPIAGGAGWSNVWENLILDQENQKVRFAALVDPFYIALSILAFSDTDGATEANDGSHKPSYTGYAPISVAASAMNSASSGSAANNTAITYAACTGGSSTIVAFANVAGISSTNVSGEFRKYGTCTSTTVSTTQTPASFASGAYVTTAD